MPLLKITARSSASKCFKERAQTHGSKLCDKLGCQATESTTVNTKRGLEKDSPWRLIRLYTHFTKVTIHRRIKAARFSNENVYVASIYCL